MDNLLIARSQMAFTLGFHIIFSALGIVLPFFIFICELMYRRTGDAAYLTLARKWTKLLVVFFAIGAVTGTLLSVEINTLFPAFFAFAGKIIGFPFSLEFYSFIFEVIFLGLYVYARDRMPDIFALICSFGIFLTASMSGFVVISANGWMNVPTGFELDAQGKVIEGSINQMAAMFNPAFISQSVHMTLAAFQSVSAFFAGLYALLLLFGKNTAEYKRPFIMFAIVGFLAALLNGGAADMLAKQVCRLQPIKCAAMEAHYESVKGAPLRIGGIPNEKMEEVHFDIEIPKMLSILAFGDPNAEVKGLKELTPNGKDRPPITITHFAFQIMVAIGGFLLALGGLTIFMLGRHRWQTGTWDIPLNHWLMNLLLYGHIVAIPLGFIAIEAGWTVTEVGRQPWIITGIMRTAEAVTPVPVMHQFIAFVGLYAILFVALLWAIYGLLLRGEFKK